MKIILFTILILITLSNSQQYNIDCVGSSITRNGYPGYANNLMIENNYTWRVHNFGVPSAGVVQNAYKDSSAYDEVISRKSERVVLLLGANDWQWYSVADQGGKDKWESEYRNLIDEFQKFSTVVLGYLIHRVSVDGKDVTSANATMDEMNDVIKEIASSYEPILTIIDFKTAIGIDPTHFWTSDGIHPNSLGSELLGIAAYEHFKQYYYLSIDDEYWEAVEDYENQKPSLFNGCSF